MNPSFLANQGDFAIQASLMVGGYLAAAVILHYLPARTNIHHAGRLATALAIITAALLPILSPYALIVGAVAATALWAASTFLSGPRTIAAHLVLLIVASFLTGAQSVTNEWVDYARNNPVATSRIGVYLAAYALVTAPAAYAIAWLLNRIDLPSGSSPDVGARNAVPGPLSPAGEGQEPVLNSIQDEGEASQTNDAIAGASRAAPSDPLSQRERGCPLAGAEREKLALADHADQTSPARGRVIGILERLILLTLALLGQWGAAGLVIAAKSIARFRNLEDRDFAEYYLIGTLASLLVAFLIAAAALAIT